MGVIAEITGLLTFLCKPFAAVLRWWHRRKIAQARLAFKKSLIVVCHCVSNERELHEYVFESDKPVYVYIADLYTGYGVTQLVGRASRSADFRFGVVVIDRARYQGDMDRELWAVLGYGWNGSFPGLALHDPERGLSLEVNPANETVESLCGVEGSRVWQFLNCKGRFSELGNLDKYEGTGRFPNIAGIFYGNKAKSRIAKRMPSPGLGKRAASIT